MSQNWPAGSFEAMADYRYELSTGDRPRRHRVQSAATTPRQAARLDSSAGAQKPPTAFDLAAESAALTWENNMLRWWRSHGRITTAGHLRIRTEPWEPYTLKKIQSVMPQLNEFDRLAVLVDLNGVVEEGYMASREHENIREVIHKIADERLIRCLQDDVATRRYREIVREEITSIFAELLAHEQQGASTNRVGARRLKCSVCKEPGHRAPTCPQKLAPPPEG